MIFAIAAAIVVAVLIVRLVFAFGWYASGLAADKAEEQKRQSEPIDVKFADPNDANGG